MSRLGWSTTIGTLGVAGTLYNGQNGDLPLPALETPSCSIHNQRKPSAAPTFI
ncbi:MAG: hypothetical protein VX893_04675 [Candidatus Latescibacterota bacterium]|nr:hypothetical protein [Candidatus Latescibacterota bacterium]